MSQDEIIRMAREAGMYQDLNVSWNQSIQNFAVLVAAAERADMRKGFAGVTLWLGAGEVTQLVTETQIKYERNQGDALTLAAEKCLAIYAGARGETK